MAGPDTVAVVMAGGSGTRFWPLSRRHLPKQYLRLFGDRSLIQETVDRILPLVPRERTFTVSGESQRKILDEQLPGIVHLLEPEGKNTAPCLMLCASELLRRGFDPRSVLIVLPADQYIGDTESFHRALREAVAFATDRDVLVTLGVQPTSPHTGYGYIEAGEPSGTGTLRKVKSFVEKPDITRAREFLRKGHYYWNSGAFIWTLKAIADAFARHLPREWDRMRGYRSQDELRSAYGELESEPIDTAVLEKADNVHVLPVSMGWSDVGSWGALYSLREKDSHGNVSLAGVTKAYESRGCLVSVPDRTVALVGVDDLILVESDGFLLVASRDHDQLVRKAATDLDTPSSSR